MDYKKRKKRGPYPKAWDLRKLKKEIKTPQTLSPSFKLAFQDEDFLHREELRPIRVQLEMIKPELILEEHNIESTVVFFGSSRILPPEVAKERLEKAKKKLSERPDDPLVKKEFERAQRNLKNSRFYEEARKLAYLIASNTSDKELIITTGGGPGIMEAANRGAHEAGAPSIGFNILIPREQKPNSYITPELCFQFHYFAVRKMHFLFRAKALIVFPGGFGTLDELFETLTLMQTKKIKKIPLLLFGKEYWQKVINFSFLVEENMISPEDINLFYFVETAEHAWEILKREIKFNNNENDVQSS